MEINFPNCFPPLCLDVCFFTSVLLLDMISLLWRQYLVIAAGSWADFCWSIFVVDCCVRSWTRTRHLQSVVLVFVVNAWILYFTRGKLALLCVYIWSFEVPWGGISQYCQWKSLILRDLGKGFSGLGSAPISTSFWNSDVLAASITLSEKSISGHCLAPLMTSQGPFF